MDMSYRAGRKEGSFSYGLVMTHSIINGDSTEELEQVEDESVDLVFADYPFYLDEEDVQKIAEESYRVLKQDGNMAVINNPSNHFKFQQYFTDFEFRNGVVLERPHSFHPAWHLGFKHNYLWLLYKDDRDKWYGNKENHSKDGFTDVWDEKEYESGHYVEGTFHPEAIPEWLTERIINLTTEEGDLVVDPFLGSGTTGVICERNNRDYIGIELEEKFYRMAKKRIDGDWSQHSSGVDW